MHGDRTLQLMLPLTTANEICCISHVPSRTSPLADVMRLPVLHRKPGVDLPDICTAVGWKSYVFIRDSLNFLSVVVHVHWTVVF